MSNLLSELEIVSGKESYLVSLYDEGAHASIGILNQLNTEDKSNLVNAINEVNVNVFNLVNRHFLFIGDSYLTPIYVTSDQTFVAKLQALGFDIESFASAGGGFTVAGVNGTFLDLLNNNVITDKVITDVVVLGGLNDALIGTPTDIESDMTTFINRALTLYPQAKVHIGFIGNKTDGALLSTMHAIAYGINRYQTCGVHKASYIGNSEYIIRGAYLGADGTHPNADGHEELAKYIGSYIAGGDIDVVRPVTAHTVSSLIYLTIQQSNNIFKLYNTGDVIAVVETSNTWDGNHYIDLGAIPNSPIFGYPVAANNVLSTIQFTVDGYANITGVGYVKAVLEFTISSGHLYVAPFIIDENGFATGSIYQLNIPKFSQVIDALSC